MTLDGPDRRQWACDGQRHSDSPHFLGLQATPSQTPPAAPGLFFSDQQYRNSSAGRQLVRPARSYSCLGSWETTEGPFAAPLYRMGLIIDAVRIAQVGVGIAQGALEEFAAAAKTPAYTATPSPPIGRPSKSVWLARRRSSKLVGIP